MRMPGELSPMASSFLDAKVSAANVVQPGEQGEYTPEMFWQDFPQFTKTIPSEDEGEEIKESLVPETMLLQFIGQANDSVLPSRWGSMWRYAAGLYTAHFAALYLKTYSSGSSSAVQAAGSAEQTGVIKSAVMGDTSISYDNSAITAGSEKWGSWNSTQYGSQLVTMARMAGMGGLWAG